MNEYDSGKMADVLREAHGMEPTHDPAAATVILFTPARSAKSTGKSILRLGRVKPYKQANPGC